MSKTQLMTNEEVLRAAGVSDTLIANIKSRNAEVVTNTLDAIHQVLMSYVSTQRIEKANLSNPLRGLEKGYADLNGGSLNGMFQEILIPTRDKGDNNLYGGRARTKSTIPVPKNPFESQDYGKAPLSYVYGINCKIERDLNYNRDDFLMALMNEALGDYITAKLATLEEENKGSRYAIENNVLGCEERQAMDYANATVFTDPYALNAYIQKVFAMQNFPESNTEYKRVKFNTTRGNGEFVLILENDFAFDFATRFQLSNWLKPFVFMSQDKDTYGTVAEKTRIITLDSLKATKAGPGGIIDPLNMTPVALPAGSKLVGRIIDFNAVKFGIGKKTAVSYPLDSRISYYTEASDYCFDLCDAYVNIPILVSTDFKADRTFNVAAAVTSVSGT